MIGWAIGVGYLAGYVMTWRRAAYVLAWDFGRPDGGDIAMSILIGSFIALAWPVIAPGYMLYKAQWRGGSILLRFMRPPRSVRVKAEHQQREAELREREYRIREMEHELGIKP